MIYQYDAERHRQVKLYILDGSAERYHRRVYISGDGVVKGYLNKPELTARKVPAEPVFALRKDVPDGRSARMRPDGNIKFLGRIGNQVKIRRYRIELGEIENRLLRHKDVKETAVAAKTDHISIPHTSFWKKAEKKSAKRK